MDVAKQPVSIDAAVQHTNDDSVVSKRSAGQHGYIKDEFLRHFVKKPSRRSPLINRGYYLRILVMTELVKRALHSWSRHSADSNDPSHSVIQVLSLGAGFDTLAARLYTELPNVSFFEVDFPAVIKNKSDLLRAAPSSSFPFRESHRDPVAPTLQTDIHRLRYHAIGVDLRDSDQLLKSLLPHGFVPTAPTVVYAECVLQYMPPSSSTKLIEWVAKHCPASVFFTYDQIHPCDSFGLVMQNSLRLRSTPLLGIEEHCDPQSILSWATKCGFKSANYANFHALSKHYIANAEKIRVEALESFDELEEWYEMCDHYGILCASPLTVSPFHHPCFSSLSSPKPTDVPSSSTDVTSVPTAHLLKLPLSRFPVEGWGLGGVEVEHCPPLPSSGLHLPNSSAYPFLVLFGGYQTSKSNHSRTSSVAVYSISEGEVRHVYARGTITPEPRLFHSFVKLFPQQYFIYGGRGSPEAPLNDAYVLTVDLSDAPETVATQFSLLTSPSGMETPPPRFRHGCVLLRASGTTAKVLVLGGKVSSTKFCDEYSWIGEITADTATVKWSKVKFQPKPNTSQRRQSIPPLASFGLLSVQENFVVITGGITVNDEVSNSVFCLDVESFTFVELQTPLLAKRFSHVLFQLPSGANRLDSIEIVAFGGSSDQPKDFNWYNDMEIFSIPIDFSRLSQEYVVPVRSIHIKDHQLQLEESQSNRCLVVPPHPRTHTRHCITKLSADSFIVVGGGFTCFSFGTYATKPSILRIADRSSTSVELSADFLQPEKNAIQVDCTSKPNSAVKYPSVMDSPYSAARWSELLPFRMPFVLRKCPMGDCVRTWSNPAHLRTANGDLTVSVHIGEGLTLSFITKNFEFRHVSFTQLVDHIFPVAPSQGAEASATATGNTSSQHQKEVWYYRSVGTNMKTERSNFFLEFPMSREFSVPPEMWSFIEPRLHQSVVRFSQGGLNLWNHYDIMDNILCQVVGRKRVILFPPSQYGNLYMVGSSSLVGNSDSPDLNRYPRFRAAMNHGVEVTLFSGDILHIPALWFHHVLAIDPSISINLFYQQIDPQLFHPKDLFANKDLPVAQQAREKAVDAVRESIFGRVPLEYDEFTLRQVICDLESLADSVSESRRRDKHGK